VCRAARATLTTRVLGVAVSTEAQRDAARDITVVVGVRVRRHIDAQRNAARVITIIGIRIRRHGQPQGLVRGAQPCIRVSIAAVGRRRQGVPEHDVGVAAAPELPLHIRLQRPVLHLHRCDATATGRAGSMLGCTLATGRTTRVMKRTACVRNRSAYVTNQCARPYAVRAKVGIGGWPETMENNNNSIIIVRKPRFESNIMQKAKYQSMTIKQHNK
jgi:hypothetical protein